jgi:hypothetical protein
MNNAMAWKPVPVAGFENFYEVSDEGFVRRSARGPGTRIGHIRKSSASNVGYLRVGLHALGKSKTVSIHKMVALAFLGPRPPSHHINHKNFNRQDNRSSNLEYTTPRGNAEHAIAGGRARRQGGERGPLAKLTWDAVRQIRAFAAMGKSRLSIASDFLISRSNVSLIVRQITWKEDIADDAVLELATATPTRP